MGEQAAPEYKRCAENFQAFDRLATFMNQDSSYLVFRRFNKLNLQNLLNLQREIAELEQRLKYLKQNNNAVQSPRLDLAEEINRLMMLVQEKLERYNAALLAQAQLNKIEKPEALSVSDIQDWAGDHNCQEATQYITSDDNGANRDDLLTLGVGQKQKDWTYQLVEKWLWRWFAKRKTTENESEGILYVYEDERIHRFVRALISTITTLILVVPIIIMYFISKGWPSLIVIVVSTALFSMFMAITTDSKNHEILMAAAAYGAVMVVFLAR